MIHSLSLYLDDFASYVAFAELPFGSRAIGAQPKVSWQYRNGAYLLRDFLLALRQEPCHTP